jgi:hypothetical protein
LFVAVIAALCVSCSDDDEPVVSPPDELSGIVTSVDITPERIPGDRHVQIRVIMAYYGSEPLELTFDTIDQYGMEIQTPDTVLAWPCRPDSGTSSLTFEPGGGRGWVMSFSHQYAREFCPEPPETLLAGTYIVRGGLLGHSEQYRWGEARFEVFE